MKKKSFVTRAIALALSSAMIVGEASAVSASELSVDSSEELTIATEETDDTLVGAYNGDVSKIIGLEAESSKNTTANNFYKDSNGNKKYYYELTDRETISNKSEILAQGDLTTSAFDAETGLYKYNNKYYYSAACYNGEETYFLDEVEIYKTYSVASDTYSTDAAGIYDSDNKVYNYNGKTYINASSTNSSDGSKITYFFEGRISASTFVDATSSSEAKNACANPDGTSTYVIGNKYYSYLYVGDKNSDGKYQVYGAADDEIIFAESYTVEFSWNKLTSAEVNTTPDGKKIYVGYQIKVNDTECSNYAFAKDSSGSYIGVDDCTHIDVQVAFQGETYKVDVRGVYYTKTETKDANGKTLISYDVYKTGDWASCTKTVAEDITEEPTVTSLKATDNGTTVNLTWDAIANAKVTVCEYSFDNELTAEQCASAESVESAYDKAAYGTKISRSVTSEYGESIVKFDKTSTNYNSHRYHYYYAYVSSTKGNYKVSETTYSNVASVEYTAQTGTPDITNFRIEYSRNGGYTIKWDAQDSDAMVYVYRYTDATFPADYTYLPSSSFDAYNASTDATSSNRYALTFDDDKDASLDKVECATTVMSNGQISLSSFTNTEVGRTYYFVAMTVDSFEYTTAKSTPLKLGGVDYYYYNYVGNPTAVISATNKLGAPEVQTTVTKDSVKLTMSDDDSATGYVIYKKNSKGKFKKLVTTTDNNYTDTDLKSNKTYTYRVYEYYYNDITGNNQVSTEYITVSATTNKVANFEVKTKMVSKKKAKISWTKVKNATKYQIYRITTNGDSTVNSKTGYATNVKLIKTIKKASKTSFTDKVDAGEKYTYRVVATYKSGKKKVQVQDESTIAMKIQTPVITKTTWNGTTVTYKWETDKYAKGYEVRYQVYDIYGNKTTNQYTYDKTADNKYSVTVPANGQVILSVRAYDDNVYSDYSTSVKANQYNDKVTGVKASYNATTGAVDVSWNPSSTAAYYYAYYTTRKPKYDEVTKTYSYKNGYKVLKESNDNESNYFVFYDEYNGYSTSIAGTSTSDYAQLKQGVKYYYYVVGFDAAGRRVTDYSAPATVTYGVEKPSITSIKNKKSKKVKLKFTAVASASGTTKYVIYRSTKKNGTYKKVGTTKKLTYTDKKLKKGKTYYYKVVATGKSALNSDFSVTSSVKKVKIKK